MKISEQFLGSYLKAADLAQPKTFTIKTVSLEKMPEGDTKPCLSFVGESQKLVLNKTNSFVAAELFGDETGAWIGRQIELYATTTSFSGRMVPCVRLRAAQQFAQPPVAQQPAPQYAQPVQQYAQPPVAYQPAPPAPVQPVIATQQPVQAAPPPPAPAVDYPMDA